MVEIVKRGLPPTEYEYQCSCQNCKSVLKYKASEAAVKTSSDPRDGAYRSFTCPVCAHTIFDSSRAINDPNYKNIPTDAILREFKQ